MVYINKEKEVKNNNDKYTKDSPASRSGDIEANGEQCRSERWNETRKVEYAGQRKC